MVAQEVLEKAIQKAIEGGWAVPEVDPCVTAKQILDWYEVGSMSTNEDNYLLFIYSHDFAKALWGEEGYYRFDGDTLDTPTKWQYHLQQIVIAPDPIKYLEEHLDD